MAPSTRSGRALPKAAPPKEPRRGRSRRDPTSNSQEQDTPMQSVENQVSTSASAQGHTTDPIHESSRSTSSSFASTSQQPAVDRATSENRTTSRYPLRSMSRSVSPSLKASIPSKRGVKRGAQDVDDDEGQQSNINTISARRKKQKNKHVDNDHQEDEDDEAESTSTSTRGANGGRGGRGGRGRGGRAGKAKASTQLPAIEESPMKGQKKPDNVNPWALEATTQAHAHTVVSPPLPSRTPNRAEPTIGHTGRAVSSSLPSVAPGSTAATPHEHTDRAVSHLLQSEAHKPTSATSQVQTGGAVSPSPQFEAQKPTDAISQEHTGRAVSPSLQSEADKPTEATTEIHTDRASSSTRADIVTAQDVLNMPDPSPNGRPNLYNRNKRKAPHDEADDGFESLSESEVPVMGEKKFRGFKRRFQTYVRNKDRVGDTVGDYMTYIKTGEERGKEGKTIQRGKIKTSAQRNSTSASTSYILKFPVHSSKPELVVTSPNVIDLLRSLAEWESKDPYNYLPTPEEIMQLRHMMLQGVSPENKSGTFKVPDETDSEDEEIRSPPTTTSLIKTLVIDPVVDKPLFTAPQTPKGQSNQSKGWMSSVKKLLPTFFGRTNEAQNAPTLEVPSIDFAYKPVKKVPVTPRETNRAAERLPKTEPPRRLGQKTKTAGEPSDTPRPTKMLVPRSERRQQRREEKARIIAGNKEVLKELGIPVETMYPKEDVSEKTRGKLPERWSWETDDGGYVPPQGSARQERNETRIAEEDRNTAGTFRVPDDSDESDEEVETDKQHKSGDDSVGSSKEAAPALVCPPPPTRNWQTDDRWGFSFRDKSKPWAAPLDRYERVAWREPHSQGPMKLSTKKAVHVKTIPFKHPDYVDLSWEVELWMSEMYEYDKLRSFFEVGTATQELVDKYLAMIKENSTKKPPVAYVSKHAPKTPSGLRYSERAYSSPIHDDEEEMVPGPVNVEVSDTLIELVNQSEVHAPLRPLPVPTKTDVINCPAWLLEMQ